MITVWRHLLRERQGDPMEKVITITSIEELIEMIDELPDDVVIKIEIDDEDGDEDG